MFHKTLKKQISPETILARVQDYIGAIKSQPNHVHLSFKVIKVDRVFSINQNLNSKCYEKHEIYHKQRYLKDNPILSLPENVFQGLDSLIAL